MPRKLSPAAVADAIADVLRAIPEHQRAAAITAAARLLAQTRMLHASQEILDRVERSLWAHAGYRRALVTSAEELPSTHVESIERKLQELVGEQVRARVRVQPSLLAGFRADVHGLFVDASLRGVLARLRAQLRRSSWTDRSHTSNRSSHED